MVGTVKRMVKIRQNHKIAYGRWDSHGDIHRDNDREERDNYRNYIYIYIYIYGKCDKENCDYYK